MEKRISAHDAWYNAQYIVGKVAVLESILETVESLSKEGVMQVSWSMDSRFPPPIYIIEMFRNKEVSEYVLNVLVNLGYEVEFDDGIYGKLSIKWGPSEPPQPL